jgi:hypothetical protein
MNSRTLEVQAVVTEGGGVPSPPATPPGIQRINRPASNRARNGRDEGPSGPVHHRRGGNEGGGELCGRDEEEEGPDFKAQVNYRSPGTPGGSRRVSSGTGDGGRRSSDITYVEGTQLVEHILKSREEKIADEEAPAPIIGGDGDFDRTRAGGAAVPSFIPRTPQSSARQHVSMFAEAEPATGIFVAAEPVEQRTSGSTITTAVLPPASSRAAASDQERPPQLYDEEGNTVEPRRRERSRRKRKVQVSIVCVPVILVAVIGGTLLAKDKIPGIEITDNTEEQSDPGGNQAVRGSPTTAAPTPPTLDDSCDPECPVHLTCVGGQCLGCKFHKRPLSVMSYLPVLTRFCV